LNEQLSRNAGTDCFTRLDSLSAAAGTIRPAWVAAMSACQYLLPWRRERRATIQSLKARVLVAAPLFG